MKDVKVEEKNKGMIVEEAIKAVEGKPCDLATREKVLGAEHPDTATNLNNLAGLLHDKRDYAGAEPLYRRGLAIRGKERGAAHPATARSPHNPALFL